MITSPTFSIVTPVRNGLPLIKGCVASLRQQGGMNFQHLIQDACSSDGTADWCMAQSDLQVFSEPDSGMYDAINKGWSRASGSYLSWLNADEQYLPGTLEKVDMAFQSNPNVDVIYGDAIIIGRDGQPLAYRREPQLRAWYIKNSFLYAYSCTLFYRKSLFDSGSLLLDSSLKYAADMDLVLRLLNKNTKFLNLKSPLALYTASGENLSTHDGMRQETQLLYSRYGGFNSRVLRTLTRIPRWIEKASVGGFMSRKGTYNFFSDEKVKSHPIAYSGLGTRYSVFQKNV